MQDNLSDVNNLINDIKHKTISNSLDVALRTEELLEKLISQQQWKSAKELMNLVKLRIRLIQDDLPTEVIASNIMRHVLKIIREEYESVSKRKGGGQSLHQLVTCPVSNILDYSEPLSSLKSRLLDHLGEFKVEIESSSENIAAQASEHIHMDEMIMTVGRSSTVEKFLKSAANERSFKVVVVEGAPFYDGHTMAAKLAKNNIQTTVIPDTAVFAMMSRINKVIIGTHTVLANGGLRAASGIHNVALAAKHFSVPVMVLSHMYKFTPMHVHSSNNELFNICASPAASIPHSAGKILNFIDVYNPMFDYVPPSLVTLFISHQGGNAPSYVYGLLSELYHQDDYDI